MTPKPKQKLPRGIRKRGNSFEVFLTHPDGHSERRSLGCVSLETAKLTRSRWQLELLEGKYIKKVQRAGAATFKEIAADYLEQQRENPKSFQTTESTMKRVAAWFEDRLARDITDDEIAAKLKEVAAENEWADATFNKYRLAISGTFKLAVKNKKLSANPVSEEVKARKLNNERTRFLSRETEADALQSEADALRAIIAEHSPERLPDFDLALHTGMRHSEMYGRHEKHVQTPGLTWEHVHLAQHFLTIPESKSGKARHIRLNATAEAALRVFKARRKASNRVMVNPDGTDYLGVCTRWFDTAVRRAGILDFTWHCLRHTFASWLAMDDVPLHTIQILMGHSSIKHTERYAHLAPNHLITAVNKLDRPATKNFPPENSTDTLSDTSTYAVSSNLVN